MNNNKFLVLRQSLLKEALNSPQLLSDLAGLETYVSESYTSRSFIELLQNADDAQAYKFYVKQMGSFVIVANNGRPFTIEDIESLCRSASSKKTPGKTIGYRGIGFKSVVSIAKEVHLISGDYEITFSKDKTRSLIKKASRVPLIRIPHDIDPIIKNRFYGEVLNLRNQGFNTFFIFSDVHAQQIVDEYTSFSSTTLLFLNHINTIKVDLGKVASAEVSIMRETSYSKYKSRYLRIAICNSLSDWLLYSNDICSIAFSIKDHTITRLSRNEAIIHAFLPTEDSNGLGVILNGDFNTDPSRRHLIFDDKTQKVISNCADLYKNIIIDNLFKIDKNAKLYVEALIPYFDLKLVQLMKPSFEKEFSKELIKSFKPYINRIKLCPAWMNSRDYYKLMSNMSDHVVTPDCSEILGLNVFLKNLGVKTDDINMILNYDSKTDISLLGYAQIVVAAIRAINLNHAIDGFINKRIFISNNQVSSLSDIESNKRVIDESFLQLLLENGLSKQDIKNCLIRLSLNKLCDRQFKSDTIQTSDVKGNQDVKKKTERVSDWFRRANDNQNFQSDESEASHRWRSAEENTLKVLNANGFKLIDVSKQNVGYDLEGQDPNGNDICIEIKSIDFPGQKFRITNNEYAAAQFNQDKYFIAIVLQKGSFVDITLIKNPSKNLHLNRQCVQWVWECSSYEYSPMRFSLK